MAWLTYAQGVGCSSERPRQAPEVGPGEVQGLATELQ